MSRATAGNRPPVTRGELIDDPHFRSEWERLAPRASSPLS
jgi:hypothetical protein